MAFVNLWEWVSKKWGPQLSLGCWISSGKQTCEGLRATQVYYISDSRQFVLMRWQCPQISDCDMLRTVVRLLWVKAWRRSISAWTVSRLEQKMGSSFPKSERQMCSSLHGPQQQNYFPQKLNTVLGLSQAYILTFPHFVILTRLGARVAE